MTDAYFLWKANKIICALANGDTADDLCDNIHHKSPIFKATSQYYVCSFTNSKDMMGPQIKLKMGYGILTTIIWV